MPDRCGSGPVGGDVTRLVGARNFDSRPLAHLDGGGPRVGILLSAWLLRLRCLAHLQARGRRVGPGQAVGAFDRTGSLSS